QRTLGSIATDPAILYTPRNLSLAESAIFDKIVAGGFRTWRIVSAQLPKIPALWYRADNLDGLFNTTLTTGQRLPVIKNIGTKGSAGDMLQATTNFQPFYEATGGPGGIPCVHCTSNAQFMEAVVPLAQTVMYVAVVEWAVTNVFAALCGGLDNDAESALANGGGYLRPYAGNAANVLGTITGGKWNKVVVAFDGNNSSGMLNDVVNTVFDPGPSNPVNGLRLFNRGDFGWPMGDGKFTELMVFD